MEIRQGAAAIFASNPLAVPVMFIAGEMTTLDEMVDPGGISICGQEGSEVSLLAMTRCGEDGGGDGQMLYFKT